MVLRILSEFPYRKKGMILKQSDVTHRVCRFHHKQWKCMNVLEAKNKCRFPSHIYYRYSHVYYFSGGSRFVKGVGGWAGLQPLSYDRTDTF